MGSSPKVPNLPDWKQVGDVQQQVNTSSGLQSQSGSMVNQNNPYGSLSYSQTGTDAYGNPTYTANMSYSPQVAALLGQGMNTASSMGGASQGFLGQALNTLPYAGQNYGLAQNSAGQSNSLINTGLGTIASGNYGSGQDVNARTADITNRIMGNELNALSPFFNMQNNWQNTDLQNRGIMPGTEAYNNAMRQTGFTQGQTMSDFLAKMEPQAFQQAATSYQLPATVGESLIQSGLGAGQLGQGYSQTGYGANASAMGLLGGAGQGLAALQSYTPSLNSTMYNTPGLNISPASYISSANTYDQAAMQRYQAQMAQQNAMWGGIGGLAGPILGTAAKALF